MDGWRELLEASTVALDLPGQDRGGTGFVIAPGVVVTCAHVVAGAAGAVRGRIVASQADLALTVAEEDIHRSPNGLDVAFLRCGTAPHPVATSPHLRAGDSLSVYGHPKGHYQPGQWATLQYLGPSRLTLHDPLAMPRGYGTPVGEGYSGSPVVNERTGAVCGMLARSDLAGSAHMVPIEEVLARCAVPGAPIAWLSALDDAQLRAGGFRHPGPRLREYLRAARIGADEHPYAMLVADTKDIPLSTVYVRQEASARRETPDRRASDEKRPAEGVLDGARHVLFTGEAGSGKSSLLRRLTFTAATAWLEHPAEAPSYVPVRIAADQLVDRPLPEALAETVRRDLTGLRRSFGAEFFAAAPLPGVPWLVCVDGLDEVLDPEARRKVVRRLKGLTDDPDLRFAVASRSLVAAEMYQLGELRQYTLEQFGEEEIAKVALAWFTELEVPDAARRVASLTDELRHGWLGDMARNPLYLTMICVIAATGGLPRHHADLYARFVRLLRDKGGRRLADGGAAVLGVTPELLAHVHDVLGPVADRRQAGDTRPLLDQVLELLAVRAPEATAPADVVERALTLTGLITRRSGGFYFLHHTVQEYLAGCAIAERLSPRAPEALRILRDAIAAEQPKLILFIAAAWQQAHPLDEFLRTAVRTGGWRDLLLCATILCDEATVDRRLAAWFTRAVIKLYDRGVRVGDSVTVNTVLERLCTVLHEEDLAALVRDGTVPNGPRLVALERYVRRACADAAALAAELADDEDLPLSLRIDIAELLAEAGDPAGACERLVAMARDPGRLPDRRLLAATALWGLDRAGGTHLLARLLRTSTGLLDIDTDDQLYHLVNVTDSDTRTALAEALAANPRLARLPAYEAVYLVGTLLSQERPEVLESLCRDTSAPAHLRLQAAMRLRRPLRLQVTRTLAAEILRDRTASDDVIRNAIGATTDAQLLERTARDERLSASTRWAAVRALVRAGRLTTAQACVDEFPQTRRQGSQLNELAHFLRELGPPARARELLLTAMRDPDATLTERLGYASRLIGMGASERIRDELRHLASDPDVGMSERLALVEFPADDDTAAWAEGLVRTASDGTLPAAVRLRAATGILGAEHRETASGLLRRIAEDPLAGVRHRIQSLERLAAVDQRAASETLHRLLDEPGIKDERLWQLLDLADALVTESPVHERMRAMFAGTTTPPDALLDIEEERWQYRAAMAPCVRLALMRMVEDPGIDEAIRVRALSRAFEWIPYDRWMALVAGMRDGRLHRLSMQLAATGSYVSGLSGGCAEYVLLGRGTDRTHLRIAAIAGVDPREAVDRWMDLVQQRRTEALTLLRPLGLLLRDEPGKRRTEGLLLAWAKDPEAPLPDRIAAAEGVGWAQPAMRHSLASDPTEPPELRVALCAFLPTSGAHNRIPLTRALATDPDVPPAVRAGAAALLTEDLGEEGRNVLRDLSGSHTTDPEAHLAAASAWDGLDVGNEAVAAYRRILESDSAAARHRVRAARGLAAYRPVRNLAEEALKTVLADTSAPVPDRVEAAGALLGLRETAEAHLGLFRLAREVGPSEAERDRILGLLPPDLRACAEARPLKPASPP
ncbi:trypsin-like peptidase domain-containing protein [Streptomyces sp. NPDC002550]